MTLKRSLVGLLGLLLIVPAAAGGSDGKYLYDAKATYTCLTYRPDYHSHDWYFNHPHARLPPRRSTSSICD